MGNEECTAARNEEPDVPANHTERPQSSATVKTAPPRASSSRAAGSQYQQPPAYDPNPPPKYEEVKAADIVYPPPYDASTSPPEYTKRTHDLQWALARVRRNGLKLRSLPDQFRSDRLVVMDAMRQNGESQTCAIPANKV